MNRLSSRERTESNTGKWGEWEGWEGRLPFLPQLTSLALFCFPYPPPRSLVQLQQPSLYKIQNVLWTNYSVLSSQKQCSLSCCHQQYVQINFVLRIDVNSTLPKITTQSRAVSIATYQQTVWMKKLFGRGFYFGILLKQPCMDTHTATRKQDSKISWHDTVNRIIPTVKLW